MIPILHNDEVRKIEEDAIASGRATALQLMETAGRRCAERILATEDPPGGSAYVVLAGQGNNGGDGLVVARHLADAGRRVRVVHVVHRIHATAEHAANAGKLEGSNVGEISINNESSDVYFTDNEVIIDCMFGSGMARPLTGWLTTVVERVNHSGRPVIAVDLPSGIMVPGQESPWAMVLADRTLTFEVPRPVHFFPETWQAAGPWELIPIGLDTGSLHSAERFASLVERSDISLLLHERSRWSHKGDHGHALLMAGGPGCHGAALLASMGCARSGAGLITLHAGEASLRPVMVALPDVMTDPDTEGGSGMPPADLHRYTSIGVGPGMGNSPRTATIVRRLLADRKGPLVLDADALNVLAAHPELLPMLGGDVVLTPHPKEMDRLLGTRSASAYERHLRTREFASRHGCTVVLKGAYTAVCTADGRAYFNPTGNAGMAKGGSGDLLTGLLTGILAQGYGPLDASLLSVYLHGLAGDLAAEALGQDAMRASDLADHLPKAWKQVR